MKEEINKANFSKIKNTTLLNISTKKKKKEIEMLRNKSNYKFYSLSINLFIQIKYFAIWKKELYEENYKMLMKDIKVV